MDLGFIILFILLLGWVIISILSPSKQSKNSSNSRFQSPLSDVSSDQNNHLKLTRDLVWQRRLLIKEKYALQLVIREKNRPLVKIKKSFIVYRQSLINHLIQKLRSIQYQT